jgi:antitoxin YefM
MDTLTAQEIQDQLSKIMELASKENRLFRVTSPTGNVVILSEETYDNLLITLEVLSTPGLMNSLREANLKDDEAESLSSLIQN